MPKFSDLSPAVQVVVVLVLGAALWGVSEYMMIRPVDAENQRRRTMVETLTREVTPLRPYRQRLRALEADILQLENNLATLQLIVPSEKEVDNFVRLLQSQATTAGIHLRRITAKDPIQQQYYVEVPFELELDGPYYDVLQFYDRLGRVERITNVADLRMQGILSSASVGRYDYSPTETVTAVCSLTTFFSKEQEAVPEPSSAPAPPAAQRRGLPAQTPARGGAR
jgi:type IV pilus assembly protein PilO